MSESLGFNQIPAQCAGLCELEQAAVDKHGIILTRKCDGPRAPSDGEVESRVLVISGEVVGVDLETGTYEQRPICRNKGFVAWLRAKEEEYKDSEVER